MTLRTTRLRRGFASPLGVMLVAALAGASLAAWHEARDAGRREALDRAGGRLFGIWLQAVHRAAQEGGAAARLGRALPAAASPAELRGLGAAVPPGLPDGPRRAAMTLGALDDGAGVETAFGVLEPADGASAAAFRAGAAAAGLADVGEVGSASPMAGHLPAIAAAMGRQPAPGALYATADFGLRYREGQLHRRAQPGRPWLNRMETALGGGPAANPPGVTGAGALSAASATVAGTASAGGAVSVAGRAAVAGALSAASMTAAQASAASLAASRRLTARSLRVAGAARAGAVRASGRLAADSLAATGLLRAADLLVGRGFDATGAATARLVSAASLEAGGRLTSGAVRASASAGSPAARFSGTVSTRACTGCR